MIKTPVSLQDLRKNLYIKAKTEPTWRFWGLYTHICKKETLQEVVRYRVCKGWMEKEKRLRTPEVI
jgi:hypothetical protein